MIWWSHKLFWWSQVWSGYGQLYWQMRRWFAKLQYHDNKKWHTLAKFRWTIEINRVKSVTTVFSLSPSKETVRIKLGDSILPQIDTPTFLGVKLDTRLTWKPHLEDMEARGIRRLALMRKLSGTTWGATSSILKTVYTGSVRPVL